MQLFAYYLEKLRATPDGDGSLLDHMMIVYGAGMADGNSHAPVNLPVLLLGGGAGLLRSGRHVSYPTATPLAVKLSEKAEEMLRADLENENNTIRAYRERVRQCEALGENAPDLSRR